MFFLKNCGFVHHDLLVTMLGGHLVGAGHFTKSINLLSCTLTVYKYTMYCSKAS